MKDDAVRVQAFADERFHQNSYLVTRGRYALVLDPGYAHGAVLEEIRRQNLTTEAILLTHAHFDHVAGGQVLATALGAPVYMHPNELEMLKVARTCAVLFNAGTIEPVESFEPIENGQTLPFRTASCVVEHYPGHSPGGCVFAFGDDIFTGDLLLAPGDHLERLPGFDREELDKSLRRIFAAFSAETTVYPGHGRHLGLGDLRSLVETT